MIGGRTVDESKEPLGEPDQIPGRDRKYIPIRGHSTCVHNVDRLVVLPNRGRIDRIICNAADPERVIPRRCLKSCPKNEPDGKYYLDRTGPLEPEPPTEKPLIRKINLDD